MFSSKTKEIKVEDIKDNIEEVSDKVKDAASQVIQDSKKALKKVSGSFNTESQEVKQEVGGLFARLYSLVKSESNQQNIRKIVNESVGAVAAEALAWTESREEEIANAIRKSSRTTRKVIYEKPFLSLAIAAGAGALITYWLTRPAKPETE